VILRKRFALFEHQPSKSSSQESSMQDRYVGDVGDFAKYGLLRHLTSNKELRLGVVWCLYDDETHNADGRHTGYLLRPEFRCLDPKLHDSLGHLVKNGRRSVRHVAKGNIFQSNTIFFDNLAAPPPRNRTSRTARTAYRNDWVSAALAKTSLCDVVFFDPDNGLETSSVERGTPKAGKYVFWNELAPFWQRGQSLVIYHHLNRTASVPRQTEILRQKFLQNFPDAGLLKPLLFRRGSCRHFWVVGQAAHASALAARIENMLNSGWAGYFESC
jgi:hypothetical protein